MSITFECPHCQTQLQAAEEQAGQSGKCPKCQHVVNVPQGTDDSSSSGSAQAGA